jgi:hypothetical protein
MNARKLSRFRGETETGTGRWTITLTLTLHVRVRIQYSLFLCGWPCFKQPRILVAKLSLWPSNVSRIARMLCLGAPVSR